MMRVVSLALAFGLALAACGGDKFVTGDGGAVGDGSADANAGDGAAADGSGDGSADGGKLRTISCKGPGQCLTLTESCCLILNQTNDQCIPKPVMASVECPGNPNSLLVMCDDATDCLGLNVCCAARQSSAFSSACVPPATCTGSDRLVMCDPNAQPSQCPNGLTCKPHPDVSRYFACQ